MRVVWVSTNGLARDRCRDLRWLAFALRCLRLWYFKPETTDTRTTFLGNNFLSESSFGLHCRISFFLPKLEMLNVLNCSLWHSFYTLRNQFLSGLMRPLSYRKHCMVITIMDDSQFWKFFWLKGYEEVTFHTSDPQDFSLHRSVVSCFHPGYFWKHRFFLLWVVFLILYWELNWGCINLKCQTLQPIRKPLKLQKCFNYTALVVLCR